MLYLVKVVGAICMAFILNREFNNLGKKIKFSALILSQGPSLAGQVANQRDGNLNIEIVTCYSSKGGFQRRKNV